MSLLKGTCCFVTGGAGFVGSEIVDQLLAIGVREIRILDNFVRGNWSNIAAAQASGRVKVVDGDIRDRSLVGEMVAGADFVFHQAALRITQCAEKPREAIEILVDGTFNVLEACVEHKVQKVIAASSASVYGEPTYLPIDEGHPFNNRTMYGGAKIFNEQMLQALHDTHGLNYVALRPFNVYGPRMDLVGVYTEVLIRWMDAIEAGKPPLIFGDGAQSMDFVYVDDVARANILAAESSITDDVFNVGTGMQVSLKELCHLLLALTNSPLKPEYREARKVANVTRRQASIEKAEKLLGFRAQVTLAEGLKSLIRWRHETKNAQAVTQEV